MRYYLVRGQNGVIIHYNFYKAQACQRYIRKSTIRKFDLFEEAEREALKHLATIVPPHIPIPDHLELNEMVTRAKLDRESRGELV